MKIEKFKFWNISLFVSLLCCWFFAHSFSTRLTDTDYLNSLNLPSDADSLMIPIAGVFLFAFFVAVVLGIVHFILFIYLKRKENRSQITLSFKLGRRVSLFQNLVLIGSFLLCGFLIYNFVTAPNFKIHFTTLLFLFLTLATTIIYAWWLLFLVDK